MKLISRQEAKARGLTRYYTGLPCANGHTGERVVANYACCVCHNEFTKKAQRKNRKHILARIRKKRFGDIPRPDTGICEICGGPPRHNRKALDLDHCHKTGKFRGWLCGNCNLGLGKLGDTEARIESALAYLRRADK